MVWEYSFWRGSEQRRLTPRMTESLLLRLNWAFISGTPTWAGSVTCWARVTTSWLLKLRMWNKLGIILYNIRTYIYIYYIYWLHVLYIVWTNELILRICHSPLWSPEDLDEFMEELWEVQMWHGVAWWRKSWHRDTVPICTFTDWSIDMAWYLHCTFTVAFLTASLEEITQRVKDGIPAWVSDANYNSFPFISLFSAVYITWSESLS